MPAPRKTAKFCGVEHEKIAMSSSRSQIVFAFGLLLAAALAWFLRDLLLLIYASGLFAALLLPLVQRVQALTIAGRQPSRGLALGLVLSSVVVLLAVAVLVILPPLVHEGSALLADWPHRADALLNRLHKYPLFRGLDLQTLQSYIGTLGVHAVGWAAGFANGLLDLLTIVLLTSYLLVDQGQAYQYGLSLIPPGQRERLAQTLHRGHERMRGWLFGQASLALILGTSSAIVFAVLHLNYFYVLALAAGLLNFVPILGPLAAAVLAAVVAGMDSMPKLIGTLAFFTVYQIVENAWLTPRIMRAAVDLPSFTVIVALSVGGALGGVLGAVVAVPTAALLAELLQEYAVQS